MKGKTREQLQNDLYKSHNVHLEEQARRKSRQVCKQIRTALQDGLTEIGEEETSAKENVFCAVQLIMRRAYDRIDAEEVFTDEFLQDHRVKRRSHELSARDMSTGSCPADVLGKGVCVVFTVERKGLL